MQNTNLCLKLRLERGFDMIKLQMVPSFLLVAVGLADCLTTVLGVSFSGASELNPVMAGVVNTNIGAFVAVKIAATIIIALTYVLASKMLKHSPTQTSKLFKFSNVILKVGYGGIIAFFCVVVINNLAILLV
jgi:membrane protein DedA with SNARE-associated domain